MQKAIKELLLICDLESTTDKVGWRVRRDAMEEWINKHFLEHSASLSVVKPELFNSDAMDTIKEQVLLKLVEELTTHTEYKIVGNTITAKLKVFKNVPDKK